MAKDKKSKDKVKEVPGEVESLPLSIPDPPKPEQTYLKQNVETIFGMGVIIDYHKQIYSESEVREIANRYGFEDRLVRILK